MSNSIKTLEIDRKRQNYFKCCSVYIENFKTVFFNTILVCAFDGLKVCLFCTLYGNDVILDFFYVNYII